jgi:hypothetical protein
MLAEEENSAGFARINRELIGKAEALDSPRRVVLDMACCCRSERREWQDSDWRRALKTGDFYFAPTKMQLAGA